MQKAKLVIKKNLSFLLPAYRGIRQAITSRLVTGQIKALPGILKDYYRSSTDPEITDILAFLESNPVQMIPYAYTRKFKPQDINVSMDKDLKLPYVIYEDGNSDKKNKIYFPRHFTNEQIQESVSIAIVEQHDNSPHQYLTKAFNIQDGDTAIIAGASDCIFCLTIIDKFKKIYLFEANQDWLEAMNATLAPFKDKVHVVNKYISDIDKGNEIKLDTFFENKNEKISYIQADIEGAEAALLRGAQKIFKTNQNIKTSLCCYHTAKQQKELTEILLSYGYTVTPSYGYMLLWMQYPLKKPYLRKGVLYAQR